MSGKARHTRKNPCPLCRGYDEMPRGKGCRCPGWTDGLYTHCGRDELAGSLLQEAGGTYAHRMEGACNCGVEHGSRPAPFLNPPTPRAERRREQRNRADDWHPDVTYDYIDRGRLVYQVCRWGSGPDKQIRQRQPNIVGGWWADLEGVEPFLYRVDELRTAPRGQIVVVCEGEKAVDACRARGLLATCSPMGAGKWKDAYAEDLRDQVVIVLPDNDAPGRKHAQAIAASVFGTAASVKVIRLPGLPEKGDPHDFFEASHTVDELAQLIEVWPAWRPDTPAGDPLIAEQLARIERDLENAREQLAQRDARITELEADLARSRKGHTAANNLINAIFDTNKSTVIDPQLKPLLTNLSIAATTSLRLRGIEDAPKRLYLAQAAELEGRDTVRTEGTSKRLQMLDAGNFLTISRQHKPVERYDKRGKVRRFTVPEVYVQLGPRDGEAPLSVAEQLRLMANPQASEAQRKGWGGRREKPICPECGDDSNVTTRQHWYCRKHKRDLGPVVEADPQDAGQGDEHAQDIRPVDLGAYRDRDPQDAGQVALACACSTILERGQSCGFCNERACVECGRLTGSMLRKFCLPYCPTRQNAPERDLKQAQAEWQSEIAAVAGGA